MTTDPSTLRLVAAGCAGLAVLMLVAAALIARRSRASMKSEPNAEPHPESHVESHAEPHVEPHAAEGPQSVEVRTLRAQVRSLEQTLEQVRADQQAAPAPTQVAVASGEVCAEAYAEALLAVRALAATTDPAEHPHRTLARVTAALQRLQPAAGSEDGWVRPTLPASVPGAVVRPAVTSSMAAPVPAPVAQPVSQPVVPAVAEPVTPAGGTAVAEPSHEPAGEPAGDTAGPVDEPVLTPTVRPERPERPEPEVVLPVPPPAHPEPRRTRRRLRRHVAA